jgi:hypothetical protein
LIGAREKFCASKAIGECGAELLARCGCSRNAHANQKVCAWYYCWRQVSCDCLQSAANAVAHHCAANLLACGNSNAQRGYGAIAHSKANAEQW